MVIFGGVRARGGNRYGMDPLHAEQERAALESIRCTRAHFAAHPTETARAVSAAIRIRSGRLAGRDHRRT